LSNKLAVFDIDGTLLNRARNVLPSTLEAIQQLQSQGVHVAIATGRNYKMAKWVIEATNIHDYVVCTGSALYIADQLVDARTLDVGDVRRFMAYTQSLGVNFMAESADELYAENADDPLLQRVLRGCRTTVLDAPGYGLQHEIVQGLALLNEQQELAAPDFKHLKFKRFSKYGVDVLPADVSKAGGIARLATHLNVDAQNVVAFGDNQNDKEMLSAAGIGIAMGHATSDVQAQADYVTDDCDNDGIYHGLQHIGWL
jgi:Cof subfamily protein (haloacid dehalogenase superfamily)